MAYNTLEYIKGLRRNMEQKKAEIVGESPSSMPGSEHDKAIPAGAKAPDKETKDQTMVPNSGLTTAGAGDDSKITHKNDLTADQAALTPKKEPEVTGDAEAQVPGGKTAEEKTAEQLGAEILAGITAWEQKQAEAKKQAADTQGPSSGEGTAEALITDTGKDPEQTGDVKGPKKEDMVSPDAMAPATGNGASGETAAAAKSASDGKDAECCKDGKCGKCAKCKAAATSAQGGKDAECCKDGKCGKCAKCKAAAAGAKKAGALDMELTQDVLAKIAAVMLATEEGTKLAESTLAKAAGAEAAEKTISFLRTQNELAQKQAEYEAGRRDALALVQKMAQASQDAVGEGDVEAIANELDAMVQAGEITEDEADQVVIELAQALQGGAAPTEEAPSAAQAAGGDTNPEAGKDAGQECKKEAQAAPAPDGNAAIDQTVAVPPEQLDPGSVPQDGLDDITPEEVAGAIDTLVQSGEITEGEADQLVQEIAGGAEAAAGAEGDVSPEEIATVLQQAVESGDLKPEDVQQVLTELEGVPAPDAAAGAAGAEGAAGTSGAAGSAGAVAPADEAKAAEDGQTAAQKTAGMKVLEAIQAARAQKKAAAASAK